MVSKTLIVALAAMLIATAFQFGYQNGATNNILKLMTDFAVRVQQGRGKTADETFQNFFKSFVTTAFLIGGFVGALIGGIMANKLGRKMAVDILAAPVILGSILMIVALKANSYEIVIVGRFVIGIPCGAFMVVGPMYLSEVSPADKRGIVGASSQLLIVISIFIAQILGLPQLLGSEVGWPYVLGGNIVLVVIALILMRFAPESPKYAYLVRKDKEQARRILNRLHSTPEAVEKEIEGMEAEIASQSGQKAGIKDIFRDSTLRCALFIAALLQLAQQWSGINVVIFYSTQIFRDAGLSEDQAIYANLGIGVIGIVSTVISVLLVERKGRRMLMLVGCAIMLVAEIVYTISRCMFTFGQLKWAVYISIIMSFIIVGGFGIGPGPIPWFLVTEVFSQEYRDAASTVAVVTNYVSNIIVTVTFPFMNEFFPTLSFLPFTVIFLIITILLGIFQPETKGKPVAEIQAEVALLEKKCPCRRRRG